MSAKGTIGFDELNDKLDRVIDTMATKDDMAEIRAEMATKEDFAELHGEMASNIVSLRTDMATKEDLATRFREMMVAIDGLMKPISELKMEYAGISMQLGRHEERLTNLENKR